jgi:hypothetical protein
LLNVPGKFHCPACRREVYTRRRKTCEFCGAELPEAVRLSPEEIDWVDDEIEVMRQRRERDREKAEEERRKNDSGSAGLGV